MDRIRDRIGDLGWFAGALAIRGLAGMLGGAAVAALLLSMDRTLELVVPSPVTNVRSVMAALIGGVLTIAVFALWMRTVVVGLASGQVSPRVVNSYLDDRFQQAIVSWMLGGLTYLVGVALSLPASPTDGEVPLVSTFVAGLVSVAALVAVLVAMRHAVGSMSPPHVIRRLAEQAQALLKTPLHPDDPVSSPLPDPSEQETIRSEVMGWVGAIDYEGIAEPLPPGGTALVPVAIGEFVAPGEVVAYCDPRVDGDGLAAIRDAVSLDRTRDTRKDLAFAIQQLVDVVQYALRAGSNDTSTAHEALVHLRAVLHDLLRQGGTTACSVSSDDRRVVCTAAWEPADHLLAAFERLRRSGAQDPVSTRSLMQTLELLERTANEVGDERSLGVLRDEQRQLTDLADENNIRWNRSAGRPVPQAPTDAVSRRES